MTGGKLRHRSYYIDAPVVISCHRQEIAVTIRCTPRLQLYLYVFLANFY